MAKRLKAYLTKGRENFFRRGSGEVYDAWRCKMDETTQDMCSNFRAVNDRKKAGAEIFKAASEEIKEETEEEVEEEIEDFEQSEEEELHCHESCKNYKKPCGNPARSEKKRQGRKKCPIKKALGYHKCGFMEVISERDFDAEIPKRTEQQRLQIIGIKERGFRAAETRVAKIAF